MKFFSVHFLGWLYRNLGTKIFFLFDSEPIHEFVLKAGEIMGKIPGIPALAGFFTKVSEPSLNTEVAGIFFENPVGMSAGFDHAAQLTQILPGLGVGFESVGTITNKAYAGNPYPRMKRLVKSKSLLVNKGFKSDGIDEVLSRLERHKFRIPVGISIGRTNTDEHDNHADAIADIIAAFKKTEESKVPFSYFELNISCPNLSKDISFYEPEYLSRLLAEIFSLKLSRPLFIKMPIILSDEKTEKLLDEIIKFPVAAVIFGNLQHDKNNPAFDKKEIEEFGKYKGNWSGMPCQSRSDELIKLAYSHAGGKLPIIGCGGIFNAEDAYRKIKLGASLVQMATGFVFGGPQLAAEICADLPAMFEKDGFKNIKEAVGAGL